MKAVFLDFNTLGPNDIDITRLTALLPDLQLFPESSPNELTARLAGAEIVIVNKVRLDANTLRGQHTLKLICLAATGTDNIDLAAAGDCGIGVSNIRDYCTPSVVQHVFSLILALTNRLREYDKLLRDGSWAASSQFCLLDYPFPELRGKTLGIVGLGSLGKGVAGAASAFGLKILATRRHTDQAESAYECVDLGTLLERSDIVSLHCPLNADTENLINAESLGRMKPGAILINTARGGLVDSAALVSALRNGEIAGAGIDVLRQEPPVDPEPIIEADLPNLIVTPHIAWAARESRQRAVDEIAANIEAFLKGENRNSVT